MLEKQLTGIMSCCIRTVMSTCSCHTERLLIFELEAEMGADGNYANGLWKWQVTVAVLVGLLTISTWYFTHSYPKTAVAYLSESLRLEILVNTSDLLNEIFSMNTYGVMAIANLMEKDFLGEDFSSESFIKVFCLSICGVSSCWCWYIARHGWRKE